ncbi:MAG: FKBP-type peptidyl-prolyl cis-trans isomerase, partial [Candidatus Aenigmarchaeota archaeon]|nr:FKBP-type peptidyl-prolyl cis-trans isomerase [Candidatus Aenigmarchaeota archaeon]
MKKNDFIEIDYTAKIKNTGEVFDLTSEKKAKELNIYNSKYSYHPIIIILGQGFILKSLEDKVFKIDEKDIGKEFTFAFKPEEAFGPREPKLIRTFPSSFFKAKEMTPVVGQTIDLEDKNGKKMTGKIMSVSAGRIRVDFNQVLAGKEIEYDFIIKRKITDEKEKINALQEFFFKQKFEFEIKDKKVIFKKQEIKPLIEMMKQKFKDMTGLDFEVAENDKHFRGPQKSGISAVKDKKVIFKDSKLKP